MLTRLDLGVTVAVAVLSAVEIGTADDVTARPAAVAVAVLLALPLLWRRRFPLEVLALGVVLNSAAAATWTAFENGAALPVLISIYSAARHEAGPRLVVAVLLLAGMGVRVAGEDVDSFGTAIGNALFAAIILGAPFVAGRVIRARQQQAEVAAEAERARIARELHDLVGHSLSVIAMRAGIERRRLAAAGAPTDGIETIERAARQSVGEMRRLLGMLRPGEGEPVRQPGLDDLDALVRDTGLDVDLRVTGERVPLSPGLELTAYRIVQESLTNALKHAPGASVRATLAYEAGALHIAVENDAPGVPAGTGTGHGLPGMRERVALYGGTLEAGPGPDGFAVRARLPYGP